VRTIVILCGAAFLGLALLACTKNDAGGNAAIVTSPAKESPETLPTSSPTNKQIRSATDDQFSFQREQPDVRLNSEDTVILRDFSEENTTLKFEVYVSFPQIEGSLDRSQKKFNTAISALARKNFDDYKNGQLKPINGAQRFPRYHEDVVEYLHIDYDIPFSSGDTISIRFSAETYGRGAAHAVQYFFVFNYDLKSGKEIRLPDLFRSSSGYLTFLSNYSREKVKERICGEGGWAGTQPLAECLKNAPLWEDGIRPNVRNFKAWSIIKEGLLFSFDECQLAACAAGEFYVLVPYSEIKNLTR
jgi:uncharacterized protein DUF3298